jgi:site-specific recombinase XerD
MKIKNLLKIYEEHLKHLKKIRRGHKKPDDLYRKIFDFFKNEEITKISERDIEKYIQSQQLVGRKNSGINHDLYAFKKFLKWAWINKYTNKKLFEKIKKIREEKYKPVILSEFELEKIKKSILEETNIDYKIIFWLLTNYGIRIGEILRLKWNEIDILRNEIAIWTEKTGGYRIFEMDSILNKMFKEKLKKGQKIQNEYVFINPKTLKPYYDLKNPGEEF